MRSSGWALTQQDWCPYKKRKGHGGVRAQKKPYVRRRHLQAQRNKSVGTLILHFHLQS